MTILLAMLPNMKASLRYAYNVLRNFCFFLVLFVFSSFLIAEYDLQLSGFVGHYFISPQISLPENDSPEIEVFTTDYITASNSSDSNSKKIKIQTPQGYAYLKPIDIMYIAMHSDSTLLRLANNKGISIKTKLIDLVKEFEKHNKDQFFNTKRSIINCQYIQEIIRKKPAYSSKYHYTYHVLITNGDEIDISKNAYTALIRLMDQNIF